MIELIPKFAFDSVYWSNSMKQYYCEITKELDRLGNISEDAYRHYILVTERDIKTGKIIIRIPGSTMGDIKINEDNIITDIFVDDGYIVKYSPNVNDIIKVFLGRKINIPI